MLPNPPHQPPNKPSLTDLMYNIETKLSLLTQIQKSSNSKRYKQSSTQSPLNSSQQQQQQSEINLPMQMLNKKMMEIINEKSPVKENQQKKRDQAVMRGERTFEKKRLNVNELETTTAATRDIDQIKRNPLSLHLNHSTNDPSQFEQIHPRQFSQSQSHPLLSSSSNLTSSHSSSRILTKFNQMQQSYTQKLKSLTFKVSFLQQRLHQTQQQKKQLMQSLQTYKMLYSRKQEQTNKQIETKLQTIKQKLIETFAQQCRLKYTQYVAQTKELTQTLSLQRKKRRLFQEQNKVLKLEKDNYYEMYKKVLRRQKESLCVEIGQTRSQLMVGVGRGGDREGCGGVGVGGSSGVCDGWGQGGRGYRRQQYQEGGEQSQLVPDKCSQILQNQHCQQQSQYQQSLHLIVNNNHSGTISNKRPNHQLSNLPSSSSNQKSKLSPSKDSHKRSKSHSKHKSSSINTRLSNEHRDSNKNQAKSKTRRVQTQTELKDSAVRRLKKGGKKSVGQNNRSNGQMMTKEELIPFLARGIQELKERLKIK